MQRPFLFWRTPEILWKICDLRAKTFFFLLLENSCALRPWHGALLSLALRGSVLGKSVLGLSLGFFCVLGLGLEPCVLDSTSGFCLLKFRAGPAHYMALKLESEVNRGVIEQKRLKVSAHTFIQRLFDHKMYYNALI